MSLALMAAHKLVSRARAAKRKAKAKRITKASLRLSLKREINKLVPVLHRAIRERDGAVCISCGTSPRGRNWQAGHLFAVGPFPSVRFRADNIHSQCSACNCWRGGNHAAYAAAYLRRYGHEAFEGLATAANQPRQWIASDIASLRAALQSGGINAYTTRYEEITQWWRS